MAIATYGLNSALSRALGVPPTARRVVLTLEVDKLPTLDVEMLPSTKPREIPAIDPDAVRAVPFMLRMRFEPFE